MESVARTFLSECRVTINSGEEHDVIKLFAEHLHVFVFNVCALANIVILLFDDDKLKPEHLPVVQSYVQNSCDSPKMKGGTSMASDFYGYNHPQYQAGSINAASDMLRVNFDSGIARPEHTMTGGAECKVMRKSVHIQGFVKDRMKSAISAKMMSQLLGIMDARMACLATDLQKNSKLTKKQLEKVFSMKKHFVFT